MVRTVIKPAKVLIPNLYGKSTGAERAILKDAAEIVEQNLAVPGQATISDYRLTEKDLGSSTYSITVFPKLTELREYRDEETAQIMRMFTSEDFFYDFANLQNGDRRRIPFGELSTFLRRYSENLNSQKTIN